MLSLTKLRQHFQPSHLANPLVGSEQDTVLQAVLDNPTLATACEKPSFERLIHSRYGPIPGPRPYTLEQDGPSYIDTHPVAVTGEWYAFETEIVGEDATFVTIFRTSDAPLPVPNKLWDELPF